MIIPTTWGRLIDHDDQAIHQAQLQMRDFLAHLARPNYKKAAHMIGRVRALWIGDDGTKQQAGPRILPTEDAARAVAVYTRDERLDVRRAALAALYDAGTAALAAASELAAALEAPEPTLRILAVRVFCVRRPVDTVMPEGSDPNKVDPTPALIEPLRRALEDPILSVRWGAVEALSTVIPRSELEPIMRASEPNDPDKHCEWERVCQLTS